MNDTTEQKTIYSVEEVASTYGVDKATILRYIRNGKLKAFRFGTLNGPYRIRQESLDAFEQESMREIAAQQGA